MTRLIPKYSQLSPWGCHAITDTPIIRATTKSQAKINCRHLIEINSRYYGLSQIRTLTQGPTVSAMKDEIDVYSSFYLVHCSAAGNIDMHAVHLRFSFPLKRQGLLKYTVDNVSAALARLTF